MYHAIISLIPPAYKLGSFHLLFSPFPRFGWHIHFISHSAISGFTTASAVVIALSQAKYFLGYEIDRSSEIVPLIKSIIAGADKGKSRKHLRFLRAMGPMTVVVLATTISKIYHPESLTLESVGIAKSISSKKWILDSNQEASIEKILPNSLLVKYCVYQNFF